MGTRRSDVDFSLKSQAPTLIEFVVDPSEDRDERAPCHIGSRAAICVSCMDVLSARDRRGMLEEDSKFNGAKARENTFC